jgi:hypothetical protein
VLPYRAEGQEKHDRAVLALLTENTADQPWWLGYLDTGADDIVFPDSPMVTLYSEWHYVLVEAGPEQAAAWRRTDLGSFWKGALPNLIFPADHSWLVSTLWDDDWTSIGGPTARGRIPAPPWSSIEVCGTRPRHHTARPPNALTAVGLTKS